MSGVNEHDALLYLLGKLEVLRAPLLLANSGGSLFAYPREVIEDLLRVRVAYLTGLGMMDSAGPKEST